MIWIIESNIYSYSKAAVAVSSVKANNLALKNLKKITYTGFLIGFSFGIGHFTTSLYWIANALLIDESFIWLIPITVLGIPVIISIFMGLLAILCSYIIRLLLFSQYFLTLSTQVKRFHICVIFSSLWGITEIARSYLILPFPWNLLGYASNSILTLMQLASLIGVHGLSFFLAFIGSIIYSRNLKAICWAILFLTTTLLWGNTRLDSSTSNYHNSLVSTRMVQPNITDLLSISNEKRVEALEKIFSTSATGDFSTDYNKMTYLIWPESGLPFRLDATDTELPYLKTENAILITGVDIEEKEKFFNSIITVDSQGKILNKYSKRILVPFGEYIPWKNFLKAIPIVVTMGEYSFYPGSDNQDNIILPVGKKENNKSSDKENIYLAPYICYEAIFPLPFFSNNKPQTDLMLNITNDVWFGNSIGPHQHLAMARMRAIEYGVPMLRVANTGISAIIDSYGNQLKRLELNQLGIIDSLLPMKIENGTFYSKYSIIILFTILLLPLIVSFCLLCIQSSKKDME